MVDSYERAREKKIAANKERMRALGVDVLAASVRKSRASPRPKVSKSAAVTSASEAPRRTSGRARKAVQSYSDEDMFKDVDKAIVSTAGRARVAYEPPPPPSEALRKSALALPERRGAVPRHPTKGHLVFKDRPDFKPNLTPAQVIAAGSWGGCYFHPRGGKPGIRGPCNIDPSEFPNEWFEGLDKSWYASRKYNIPTNMYGVKAGQTQTYWEESGWIDSRDPRGWFHWYCRFYQGRRLNDGEDDRQISRWKGVCGEKGRWKTNLINKIINANASWDDSRISPVVRQTLLHWACEVRESEVLALAKKR
jgi:hypothetical protein